MSWKNILKENIKEDLILVKEQDTEAAFRKKYSERDIEDMYEDMLDDVYGTVEIAGMTYDTSRALRDLDPIAYRVGMADYEDSLLTDFEEEMEDD